ncbi:uncharacterized protein LOC121737192 [Aricia agestis]|uniref:uncharacterized protein LOC121737192 n=1 Tax=Aricia agestis TaxID=91739 RepID=UPI001C207C12|nr:uncharacterized protein LOC121737192 [Aricia agestis]
MGSQRMAAVAAVSHASRYYNHTQPVVTEATHYTVNIFFVSATLCGVLVAVCAACWRRSPSSDKPEEVADCRGIYTVSADTRLHQELMVEDVPGPPPDYETVVDGAPAQKDCSILQEVVSEPCPRCAPDRSGLPSYEAAIMLRDTKL